MTARRPDSRLVRSERDDGRGHWPAGRRRKPRHPAVPAAVAALCRSIRRRGLRATARALGVDPRTVSRWVRGERHPSPDEAARAIALA